MTVSLANWPPEACVIQLEKRPRLSTFSTPKSVVVPLTLVALMLVALTCVAFTKLELPGSAAMGE